jgi:hypothetical protein
MLEHPKGFLFDLVDAPPTNSEYFADLFAGHFVGGVNVGGSLFRCNFSGEAEPQADYDFAPGRQGFKDLVDSSLQFDMCQEILDGVQAIVGTVHRFVVGIPRAFFVA